MKHLQISKRNWRAINDFRNKKGIATHNGVISLLLAKEGLLLSESTVKQLEEIRRKNNYMDIDKVIQKLIEIAKKKT